MKQRGHELSNKNKLYQNFCAIQRWLYTALFKLNFRCIQRSGNCTNEFFKTDVIFQNLAMTRLSWFFCGSYWVEYELHQILECTRGRPSSATREHPCTLLGQVELSCSQTVRCKLFVIMKSSLYLSDIEGTKESFELRIWSPR